MRVPIRRRVVRIRRGTAMRRRNTLEGFNMRSTSTYLLIASLAVGFWATAAFADPTTDGNSMESDIDITIPVMTELTGVTAQIINETEYLPGDDVDATDAVCVFSNDPTNTQFALTMTCKAADGGACTGGGFFIDDNGGHDIPYHAYFGATGGSTERTVGQTDTVTGGSTLKDCNAHAADNMEFRVQFLEADILAKPAGGYAGTLVINVTPVS